MGSTKNDSVTDTDNSDGDVPVSDTPFFSEGEKVLAYHGPRLYEAKVQKSELRKKEWRYFVHYLGWNKNWDEWVEAERLLKYSQANVKKQRALEKKQGVDKSTKTASRSAQSKPKSSTDVKQEKEKKTTVARGRKRKADSITEDNASEEKPAIIKIYIPSTLKKQLVDDWDFINQQDKLVKLPRSPTVDDILTMYLEYRTSKDGKISESTGEILNGLRRYFDKSLDVILLYNKERQQCKEAIVDGSVSPSTVYGAEHLLRLFVKLPDVLSRVRIEEEAMSQLQSKLVDVLKFMQRNQGTFFLTSYEPFISSENGKEE